MNVMEFLRAKDGAIDLYWDRDENDDDYGSGVKIIAIAPQEMNLKFYEHDDEGVAGIIGNWCLPM